MRMAGLLVALLLPLSLSVHAADWPQFRGRHSDGLADGPALKGPLGLPDKPVWKADLPGRGVSGPIVIGTRVFVTASSGPRQNRLHVLAFDARTGKRLWQRTIWATGPTDSHPKTCMAAPTPASDGHRVVALFATNDVVCLDLDGNVLWLRSLYGENPGATDGRGLASSPVIVGGHVIVQVENQNTSFAVGIDLHTGKSSWHLDRPRQFCWTSPIAVPGSIPADTLVLLQGSTRLSGCDPATGRELWGLDHASDPIASSVVAGDRLLVPGDSDLAAFTLGQGGKLPQLAWQQKRLNPTMASPLVAGQQIYSLRGAILACGDIRSGKVLSQTRLRGPVSASPVLSGDHLIAVSESGEVQFIHLNKANPSVVERGDLHETILATPAIADGALYLRSDKHLWRFGKGAP